jgi:hypothetical protein
VRGEDDEGGRSSFVADTSARREVFRTRGGRIVHGGGGIAPDVELPADTPSTDEQALEAALGKRIPEFRRTLTAYARTLRLRRGVASPDFSVTPGMLDDFHRELTARGVALERSIFDAAAPAIAEALGDEAARVLFGRRAEFRRRLAHDRGVVVATELLAGASSQGDVLRRADRRAR